MHLMAKMSRRTLIGAVAASASAAAWAQDPPTPGSVESRLLTNVLTRMAVPVDVEGRGGWNMVLDTGAGRTAVSAELAQALDLPAGPPVLVHGITAAELAPTVRIRLLTFGGRRFNDLTCPVFPREVLAADGLIGLDVLSGFRLDLDVGGLRVRLTPSGGDVLPSSPTFSSATRMRTPRARRGRFGQLILPAAAVDEVPTEAFVDTGAQYSIGNMALLRAMGGGVEPPGLARIEVFGVTGQSRQALIGSARRLVLSTRDLGRTDLLFSDLHAFDVLGLDGPALLIGADLLRRFRSVVLDFGQGSMGLFGLRPAT